MAMTDEEIVFNQLAKSLPIPDGMGIQLSLFVKPLGSTIDKSSNKLCCVEAAALSSLLTKDMMIQFAIDAMAAAEKHTKLPMEIMTNHEIIYAQSDDIELDYLEIGVGDEQG